MEGKQHLGQHLGTVGIYDPEPLPVRNKPKKKKPVVLNPIAKPKAKDVGDSAFANVIVSLVGGTALHATHKKHEEKVKLKPKATIYDKLSSSQRKPLGPPGGFTFDGNSMDLSASTGNLPALTTGSGTSGRGFGPSPSALLSLQRPNSSGSVSVADLDPRVMFPDKHDKLSGAFFAVDKDEDPNTLMAEASTQFRPPPRAPDVGHTDGTLDGKALQFDVTQEEKDSAWYRWRNGITDSTVPKAKASKSFVLVDEEKLKNLSQFEQAMTKEGNTIGFLSEKASYNVKEDSYGLGLNKQSNALLGRGHSRGDSPGRMGGSVNVGGSSPTTANTESKGGDCVNTTSSSSTLVVKDTGLRGLIRDRTDKLDKEFDGYNSDGGNDFDETEDGDAYPGVGLENEPSILTTGTVASGIGMNSVLGPRQSQSMKLLHPQTHANVLNSDYLDPRKPTPKIASALKVIAEQQFKLLIKEWDQLDENWTTHSKQNHYNRDHLFRDYTDAKVLNATHEKEGQEDWLLKNCPIEVKVRKLKSARNAYYKFLRRQEQDSMLYEDDRSYLFSAMYEAKDRSVDYDRYVFLCGLFGPMSEDMWEKAGARPGLAYWVKATDAALKIQHCWDKYWSYYKLHRYRASRLIQTLWRKYYCLANVAPLVRIRLKFGKRTYYYFVLATWQRYNFVVKNIARLLKFRKYEWAHNCMDAWKKYVKLRTVEKKAILQNFQRRFDVRSNLFHRLHTYCKRSQYLKCVLRNYYYMPQFKMWVDYTANSKRFKKLSRLITPVQAFIRMKLARIHHIKVKKSKHIMLRFCFLMRSRAIVRKTREQFIDKHLISWKPAELIRREVEKEELERRRQLREIQLSEEKALVSIGELQKHFKSYSTNGRTQIIEDLKNNEDPTIITKKQMEYQLYKRCYISNYEQQRFEYRTKKAPHIICADPLCGKIFASNEAYIQHIQVMMDNPKKCTRGVMKVDIQSACAERGLEKVGIKAVRMRDRSKDVARKGIIGGILTFLESTLQNENSLLTKLSKEEEEALAAEAAEEEAERKRVEEEKLKSKPKSAAEKLREKRKLEQETAARKEKEEADAKEAAKLAKKEAKKLKKAAAKMSDRQKRLAGIVDEEENPEETDEEKEKRLEVEAAEKEAKRLAAEEEKIQAEKAAIELAKAEAEEAEETKAAEEALKELAAINEANSTPVHMGLRRHTVFPMANFAKFHILMCHMKGFFALRTYVLRKCGHTRLVNTMDCWEAIQMWRLGSIYSQNDGYVTKSLSIYETFLRDNCDRPIAIHMADGNILNNHYSSVANIALAALALSNANGTSKKTSKFKMMVKKQQQKAKEEEAANEDTANIHEGLADYDWWDTLIDRLLEVKNRDFIGYFGTKRASKNCARSILGVSGKNYQSWSEHRSVAPDVFDALEWACFQSVYRFIYYQDKLTAEDEATENELKRLILVREKKERAERKKKLDLRDYKSDQKHFRLAREGCLLIINSMKSEMRVMRQSIAETLGEVEVDEELHQEEAEEDYWHDDYWDITEDDPCYQIREKAVVNASEYIVKALHQNIQDFFESILDEAIVLIMQQEFVYLGESPGCGGHLPPCFTPPPELEEEEEVYEVAEYVMGKRVSRPKSPVIKKEEPKVDTTPKPELGLNWAKLIEPVIVLPADYTTIKLFELPYISNVIKQLELLQEIVDNTGLSGNIVNTKSREIDRPSRKTAFRPSITPLRPNDNHRSGESAGRVKKESVLVKARRAAMKLEIDKTIPSFNHSAEFYTYQDVVKTEAVDHSRAFRDDCKRNRKEGIDVWAKNFKQSENDISVIAYKVSGLVLDNLVDLLGDLVCKVCTKEKVFEISYEEQQRPESMQLLNEDAVAHVEENMLDHVFDHYTYALINTMLGMEDQREGCLEYGGFLKGQKVMKKKLEMKVVEAGRRIDDSWFKNCIKDAISEDLKHMPLDYMGCVRLVQRRFRGMLGRNTGRRTFAKFWLKKYDPSENKAYYVNGRTDPPTVTWERPKFMLHLYPKTKW